MGELIPKDGEPQARPVLEPEPEPTPAPATEPAPVAPASNVEPPPVEQPPVVAPANEQVLVTQKVRAPHLMPFERYEFQASEVETSEPPETPAAPGAPAQEPPPPTQEMPVADSANTAAAPPVEPAPKVEKIARQPAEFSIDKLKGLAEPGPESAGPKGIVLVADDDSRARVMYRMKLEQSGFDVREAKDGIDAWKLIKAGEIEFLVTDMKMPGYHGLEILGRMIDAGIKIPVVVVSAFDQLENEFVVSTYPKLKFLPKPASPESVAAAVSAFAREASKQSE
jgi:CheY-like chemotaxis protein